MIFGIVMSMLNIMAEYDMCKQMTEYAPERMREPMRARARQAALGTGQ